MPAASDVDAAPSSPGHAAGFLERVGRVFSFDTSVYEEVAAAGPATFQAVVVIAVAAMLSGSLVTIGLFFIFVPLALIGVGVSALLVMIAVRLFSSHSPSLGEWYRALGFAQAPLAIGLVPFVGSFIALFYWVAADVAAISRVARIPVGSALLTFLLACFVPFLLLAGLLILAVGADALLNWVRLFFVGGPISSPAAARQEAIGSVKAW